MLFIETYSGLFNNNSYGNIKFLFLKFNLTCFFTKFKKSVFVVKGAISGLRQFLATESPLKMMRNAFYFT